MGISLTSENWGCHRSADHRGKHPARLIAAVLGCTHRAAQSIAAQYDRPDPESLTEALTALEGTPAALPTKLEPLVMPDHFKLIGPVGLAGKFYRYLEQRDFNDVGRLCRWYDLRCALIGRWKDRLIIPFFHDGALIGWTARAIAPVLQAPRYLSTSAAVKDTIFDHDAIALGGKLLIITEGPFDAMKLGFYGRRYGLRATCVFGTSMTLAQVAILNRLSKRYDRVLVLFDPEAIDASFGARDWLLNQNVIVGSLPTGIEDPGSMTQAQCTDYFKSLKLKL